MANSSPIFEDWQRAEAAARAAEAALHSLPLDVDMTQAQEEAIRLRAVASEKLLAMVADAKARTPLR